MANKKLITALALGTGLLIVSPTVACAKSVSLGSAVTKTVVQSVNNAKALIQTHQAMHQNTNYKTTTKKSKHHSGEGIAKAVATDAKTAVNDVNKISVQKH